jgi:lysophospholipase L1-like esterase
MEFRTIIDIPHSAFQIEPHDEVLFVGSCFATEIGRRFQQEQFPTTVNPYGTMYNPASVLHTIERSLPQSPSQAGVKPTWVFITLGTNHVYREKATGEIVDNCQKRPAALFQEELLSVEECAGYLQQCVNVLRHYNPEVHIVFTVSPIRYKKYGYHESQLSKATLLMAVEKVVNHQLYYFPAYEIMMDELRDYRFYREDMLHPTPQAVEYIWQQLVDHYFSPRAQQFLQEWAPLKAALNHRPFNPDSDAYRQFLADTNAKVNALLTRYGVCPE